MDEYKEVLLDEKRFTAYHGTGVLFRRFECPAYFTNIPDVAAFFARQGDEPQVLECLITLNNPLIVDLGGQSWGGFWLDDTDIQNACIQYSAAGDIEEEEYFNENGLTIGFLAEYASLLGYDGVIAHECYEEDGSVSTQYVVFDPDNIQILERKTC